MGEIVPTCPVCKKACASQETLDRHMEKRHTVTDTKEKPCTECDKCYSTMANLIRHEVEAHGWPWPSNCKHCGQGFVDSTLLYKHVLKWHKNDGLKRVNSSKETAVKVS